MRRSPFYRKVRWLLQRFVAQKILVTLTILFCLGATLTIGSVWQLSEHLIKSQALQNAAISVKNLKLARTLYSNNVASRIQDQPSITITHDYQPIPGGIPVPATYLIELGEEITANQKGMRARIFSDYPFPLRQETGGARDAFEREAIAYLEKHPEKTFAKFENLSDRWSLRYAEADIMKPSCIDCHNNHPESPKKDWQVGDVRGVVEIVQPVDGLIAQTQKNLTKLLALLISFFAMGFAALVIAIRRLNRITESLELEVIERTSDLLDANQKLIVEQEKTDNLLLNILPPKIATQLKNGSEPLADRFGSVSILFADIVGFTELSATYSPDALVSLLNEIFSAFDQLCEQLQLEKIKTIGDAYMVAAGLPEPRNDHAMAIAEMALMMQQELEQINQAKQINIRLRIGINSGPVVAGVIGKKKFIYDLWGDAVNTASRMESHGIADRIQVTESTYDLLKQDYQFEARGEIDVKGKGKMLAYLLVKGRSPRQTSHPS